MKRLKYICVILLIAVLGFIACSAEREEPVSEEIYLIATLEDFEGFIRLVRDGETKVDARLTADIYFNDASDFENWEQTPPAYQCPMISRYEGTFDGDGYSLVGYYSAHHPVFGELSEGGCIRGLNIRLSYFATLYENRDIPESEDEEACVNVAAGLCGYNYGEIEGCAVDAKVMGDGMAAGIVAYNGGIVKDCTFSGEVEGARCMLRPEEALDIDRPRWHAGGITANNYKSGTISGCTNYGKITLHTGGMKIWRSTHGYANTIQMESCAGGLAGRNNGLMENCMNEGAVFSGRVSGALRVQIPVICGIAETRAVSCCCQRRKNSSWIMQRARRGYLQGSAVTIQEAFQTVTTRDQSA